VVPGIYDLLKLSNGGETYCHWHIRNFKSTTNKTYSRNEKHSGTRRYNLSIEYSSAEQSGLKLQVNQTLQEGIMYHVLLDFDANKSIVKLGNGGINWNQLLEPLKLQ
jgi:hypothetical protein